MGTKSLPEHPNRIHLVRLVTAVGLACLLLILLGASTTAQRNNLLQNGGFEDGFIAGLGVAEGWNFFTNGNGQASFYDDTWELVVAEGDHSQAIELAQANTLDAYAGIYQTVVVTPGQTYDLSFKGIIRSEEGSVALSNFGYRLEYAIDLTGNEAWEQVNNWVELPWDEQPIAGPSEQAAYSINSVQTQFDATGESVTLFIRAHKKWADQGKGIFNVDAVRLVPAAQAEAPTATPTPQAAPTATPTVTPIPESAAAATATPAAEPLPETGGILRNSNPMLIAAGIFLILLLTGGAVLNLKQRPSDQRLIK